VDSQTTPFAYPKNSGRATLSYLLSVECGYELTPPARIVITGRFDWTGAVGGVDKLRDAGPRWRPECLDERNRMSPCQSCHAGCCRSFAVPVTGADILRIERTLGLDFWAFVCRWADPQGIIARNHAPHFYFADEPSTPFAICLTHAASEFFPGTTKCRFLTEGQPDAEHPHGLARCGIYNSRPAACRAFPAKLNSTNELAVLYDVPPRGRTDTDDPLFDLCPRSWQPEDLEPVSAVQDLVIARYEMGFFRQLATVWNSKPRPWAVFPDFLRLVYNNRVTSQVTETVPPPQTIPLPPQPVGQRRAA
jgi:Fe-S-cluster containining protein